MDDEGGKVVPFEREIVRAAQKREQKAREEKARKAREALADDPREVIALRDGHEAEAVDALALALARHPDVFERGGELVEIVRDERDTRAHPLTLAGLGYQAARAVVMTRPGREGGPRKVAIDREVLRMVHARRSWAGTGVRRLVGIASGPVLRADGGVCVEGYDEASGLYVPPGGPPLSLPGRPSREDAARALEALREPFAEFPWEVPEGWAVPVAVVLSLVGRSIIDGPVPGFGFDASRPGSGKSLAARVVSILAMGREPPFTGWPAREEERAKHWGALAEAARPLVVFDNVTGDLSGETIERALTCAGDLGFRRLGTSAEIVAPWRTVVVATGNGLHMPGDARRRWVAARMLPPEDAGEDRSGFTIPDLPGWARANRGRLLSSAITLLRAYVAAGYPEAPTMPSFEGWARLVAGSIAWAGGPDVLAARVDRTPDEDPQQAALVALLSDLPRLDPKGRGLTVGELLTSLRVSWPPNDEGFGTLRSALETLAGGGLSGEGAAQRLGTAMRPLRGRRWQGWELAAGLRGNRLAWRARKTAP